MMRNKRGRRQTGKIAVCIGLALLFLLICPERFLIFVAAAALIILGLTATH